MNSTHVHFEEKDLLIDTNINIVGLDTPETTGLWAQMNCRIKLNLCFTMGTRSQYDAGAASVHGCFPMSLVKGAPSSNH